MNHSNPLFVARESRNLARGADGIEGQMFKTVTMVCMCLVAVQAGMHVLNELQRSLERPERGRGR